MRFRVLNRDPLYDYREACKVTQGVDMELQNTFFTPKDEVEFWIKQILTNHSTLRCIRFRMTARAPKSVVMQIIRATKEHPQPEVQSSRPDWTGKERSNDPYEEKLFSQDHSAWSFIEMAKQRLCVRTEAGTRRFMNEAVLALTQCREPFLRAVGYCCHPACWWMGGCPEIKSCGAEPKLSDKVIRMYRMSNNIPLHSKEEEAEEALDRR